MPFLAPVIGAIGSALGAIGSFVGGGIVGKLLISVGLNVASALIQNALKKKPKGGVKLEREYGADVSRSVACGLVGVAGHDVYVNTYGDGNKDLQQLFVLSDYPCDGLSRVAINGEWATLDEYDHPDWGHEVTSGDYAGLIWVKFVDGTQTTASSYLIDNANPEERWSSDHIGVGICYALVSMRYHQKKNYQFPDFFFEFRGAKLYDWRKDSSVGGSGSHRWNDPSTHEFSRNPIVIDYNYRRGFSVNGDMFCGMGMDPDDLPLARYALAANLCDEINEDDGEPRYTCSILLDAGPDGTHGDNIEALMLSCGGMVVDGVEGSWPIVGSDQPSVATITDDDLIVGAPVRFRKTRSMGEVVNSISGNYPEPDEFWGMVGYERQLSDTGLVLDRRTRDLGMDFPQVSWKRQAEALAHIYLEESRLEATATITVRPRWQGLQPGDWIVWDSARYGERTYLVAEASLVSLDGENPRCVQLTLQERNGVIYDGVTSPAVVLPWPPGVPELLSEVDNFQLLAVLVEGSDDKERPAIRASWDTIDDPTVTHVELRYWPTDQTDAVIYHPPVEVDVTTTLIVTGVVGNTEYHVESRLITSPPRVIAWADGAEVTTIDTRFGPGDFWPIDLDHLAEDVRALHEWVGQGTRELIDQIMALATFAADQDLSNFDSMQTLRQEIVSERDGVISAYREEILVATGPGSALAQRIAILEVAIKDQGWVTITDALSARITITENTMVVQGSAITSIQAALTGYTGANAVGNAFSALDVTISDIEGDLTAVSNAVLGVESTVANFSANGYFRVYSEAASSGAVSRIGLSVSATGGGSTRAAAIFLEAKTGSGSRVIIDAQNLYFGDLSSGSVLNPFIYTGGQWYIGTINIQNAIVGNLVVDTHNIATGAVTASDASDQGSGSTSIANGGTNVRTMAFSGTAGATRLVKGYVDIDGFDGGGNGVTYNVTVTLWRNSTSLKSKTITMYPVTTDGSNGYWQTEQVIFARDTGGSASNTYYLTVSKQSLTPALYATNGYLEVVELKR